MRLLAARSVPFVTGLRDIRRIGPALVAGLIGLAALLVVLGTHALAPRDTGEDVQQQSRADASRLLVCFSDDGVVIQSKV